MSYNTAHLDYYRRKHERKNLDSYAASMVMFDPVTTPEQELIARQLSQRISDLTNEMPARVCRVVRMYYGIGCEPHTLDQVGEQIGVTRERVRQLRYKGEQFLKRKLFKDLRPDQYRAWQTEQTAALRREQQQQREREEAYQKRVAEAVERERERTRRDFEGVADHLRDEYSGRYQAYVDAAQLRAYRDWAAAREAWLHRPPEQDEYGFMMYVKPLGPAS